MKTPSFNVSDPISVRDTLCEAAQCLLSYQYRKGCTNHIPSEGQLFLSGDLHDNPFHLTKLAQIAELENKHHQLVLQELIHASDGLQNKDLSHRMLIRAAVLVLKHQGQVHPILANHELAQSTGRKITKAGLELNERFTQGVEYVFARKAEMVLEAINTFIHAMPIAVKTESGLMCSHSLPNEVMMPEFDLGILDRELHTADYQSDGSAYFMVWGRQHTKQQINRLAKEWGVKLFCLGHAWIPSGIKAVFPNMLQLNSDHQEGVVLPINLEKIQDAMYTASMAVKLRSIRMDLI